MKDVLNFLLGFRNDVFKLLPMKEAEMKGMKNHLSDYLDSLVVNAKGSVVAYPELSAHKQYIYVINNLAFLMSNKVDFNRWRKIILNSTRHIDDLYVSFGGVKNDKEC